MAIEYIVSQHAEETAFLWLLRNDAIHQPHYDLNDIAKLDNRVEAHIDGLRIAGDLGWELCKTALEKQEPGEVFAAAFLAFESGESERVDVVIEQGIYTLENLNALVSALAWLPFQTVQPWLQSMADANADAYRYLSIAAYATQRVDPGEQLNQAIYDSFPLVQARALRAVGELKRNDLRDQLTQHYQSEHEMCRFWSSWSGVLLGDYQAIEAIKPFFIIDSPYFVRTLQLVLRVMDVATAHSWLQSLAQFPDTERYVIQGAGVIGDPVYVPWLVKQMENEDLAKVAGEAFSMITGVDLAYDDLDGEGAEDFETGPNENPKDPNVAMDADEDLPWPEPGLIERWWQNNKNNYVDGNRYLVGNIITAEHCRNILKSGFQRQREAAALELAIRQVNEPLFETRSIGKKQKRLIQSGSMHGAQQVYIQQTTVVDSTIPEDEYI